MTKRERERFGRRVQKARKANGRSQALQTYLLQWEEWRLPQLEAGHREPTVDELLAIGWNLNVSIDYLLGRVRPLCNLRDRSGEVVPKRRVTAADAVGVVG